MPYTILKYHRNADGSTPDELIAVNPLGTAPVITDGDVTLAESGAIVGQSLLCPRSVIVALNISRNRIHLGQVRQRTVPASRLWENPQLVLYVLLSSSRFQNATLRLQTRAVPD